MNAPSEVIFDCWNDGLNEFEEDDQVLRDFKLFTRFRALFN